MNKFEYALYIRRQQEREHRSRALEQQRKRIKQQERKGNIILAVATILIVGLCIFSLTKLNKQDMTNCINAGHSKEYCERGF